MAHPDKSTVRRAIILLSDGDDNQSRVTREKAIEMAQRAEVVIYAISTNLADKGRGDRELERMATATGGRAFFPLNCRKYPTPSLIFRRSCAASTPSVQTG